jgi:phenylalanyl-tRNA synthetase beta chain
MLISLNWLSDYVAVTLPAEQLARKLTEAGLPVEGIERVGDDTVLNVEVTSNRPDCLGHLGVAREVAALTGQTLRMPDAALPTPAAAGSVAGVPVPTVTVESPDLCPQYIARTLAGVRVAPSPMWMQKRLDAVGVRAINNLVDVTNYVLMEVGQPLHAFDYDRLAGHAVVVRRARAGEKLTAINEKVLEFHPDKLGVAPDQLPLVIADAERPVAVAGIMGGLASEVSSGTRNVLLESAEFEMLAIRRAVRALDKLKDKDRDKDEEKERKFDTEAAYRFERGVDPLGVEWASRRAARLMLELAGGTLVGGPVAAVGKPYEPLEVTLRLSRIPAVVGITVSAAEARATLERLGFEILSADDKAIRVRIPAYRRRDVSREIDLVEEVVRIHGYGDLPDAELPVSVTPRDPQGVAEGRVSDVLEAAGFFEVISKSMVKPDHADLDEPSPERPRVSGDAAKTAYHDLRRSLLPGLLDLRRKNQNVGVDRAAIYEIAHAFRPRSERGRGNLPDEPTMLAILADGESEEDWRRFRGALEAVFGACDAEGAVTAAAAERSGFEPGATVVLSLGGRVIGHAGKVARATQKKFDLRRPVLMAELELEPLVKAGLEAGAARTFKDLPRFPAIVRDLNIVIDQSTLWRDIEQAVRAESIAELESLDYQSTYAKGLGEGKKSVTFSMSFRAPAGTLTREQADAFQQRVLERLRKDLSAELRA